jgi:hypothetical protein
MAIVAFAITWAAMGLIAYISSERKRL